MKKIIERGIECAPCVGISGAFYPGQFAYTPEEWDEANERVLQSCANANERENPDGTWNGYWRPLYEKDDYVYLYRTDSRGDWDSVAFTHSTIASRSKYPYAKCCGSCKHCAYSEEEGRKCTNPESGYIRVGYTERCKLWEDNH